MLQVSAIEYCSGEITALLQSCWLSTTSPMMRLHSARVVVLRGPAVSQEYHHCRRNGAERWNAITVKDIERLDHTYAEAKMRGMVVNILNRISKDKKYHCLS